VEVVFIKQVTATVAQTFRQAQSRKTLLLKWPALAKKMPGETCQPAEAMTGGKVARTCRVSLIGIPRRNYDCLPTIHFASTGEYGHGRSGHPCLSFRDAERRQEEPEPVYKLVRLAKPALQTHGSFGEKQGQTCVVSPGLA